jgi:Ca2+-binding EF-hand superfamily protein
MLDKDGSGSISVNEIKTQFGNNISSELWLEIIKEADENGDGEI